MSLPPTAILALAALGLAFAGAPAWGEGRKTLLPLTLKIAPPEALLYLDGEALGSKVGGDGLRRFAALPAEGLLLIEAPGYYPEAVRLDSVHRSLELKLERPSPFLRLGGFGPTGARPKSAEWSPDGRLLVLPLLSGPGADILDARTLRPLGRLEPPPEYAKFEGFVESAFLPARNEIWVSQMHSSRIHVFDLRSFRYRESFPSGGNFPKVIALSPGGDRAYISHWLSDDVAILDTATRKVLARVKVGPTPRGLAASPDGRYLYVARFGDGAVVRVRLDGLQVESFWKADGGAKRHLVLDPSRGLLYASDMHRGSLFVLRLSDGSLVKELPLGDNPNTIKVSPDYRYLYATTRGPNNPVDYEIPGPLFGEFVVIELEGLQEIARQWGGDQPTGLAVSPSGRRVVFTDFLDRRVEAYDLRLPPAPSRHPPR